MLPIWLLLALLPARDCAPGRLCTCAILPPERAYEAAEMVFTAVVEGGQPFGVPEELRGVVHADLPVLRALAREPRRAESDARPRVSAVPPGEVRR